MSPEPNSVVAAARADCGAMVTARRTALRSHRFALGRRSLLLCLGGAAATTTLLGHRVLAAAPAAGREPAAGLALAPRAQASPAATPSEERSSAGHEAEDVLAINFLLEPDAALADAARGLNARLRESYPAGYPLDESHAPHITVVQRFVRASDLDPVSGALTEVLDAERPLGWPLKVTGYEYVVLARLAVMLIAIERSAELDRLQQEAIEAIAPFAVERGTEASFVPSPDFDPGIIDYVETFVPNASGENYRPHLTVGVAGEEFVKRLAAEPVPSDTSQVAGAAVYQIGVFGTAAKRLWSWTPQ